MRYDGKKLKITLLAISLGGFLLVPLSALAEDMPVLAPPRIETIMLSKEIAPPLQIREDFLKQVDAQKDNKQVQEQLLRDWLTQQPGDEEIRFYLARVLSWQGKYAESLKEYGQIRLESPDNVDYLLGNAQVLLWDKQPEKALELLNQAQQLSPSYEDVYTSKIQALSQLGKSHKDELKAALAEAKHRFPQSDWDDEEATAKAATTKPLGDFPLEVETGYSFDHVNNRFADWNGQYISIRKPFSQRAGIYGQARRTSRYDIQDYDMMAGTYLPVGDKWGVVIEGSLSPTGEVIPLWSGYGEINRKLPWGFVAHAGFRHTAYKEGTTELGTYTIENYWKRVRTAYTFYNNYLHDAGWSNSHVGQVEFYYGKHENSIGLTGALGKELTNLGSRGVMSTDVSALYLNGVQWIFPRFGVTYLLGVQKQGDLYTRRGFQLGIRYLF